MKTREQMEIEEIAKIRENNKHISEEKLQLLIDDFLTNEADKLEPGHVLAIVQASVFGMFLMGLLSVVKYSLLPLLLL